MKIQCRRPRFDPWVGKIPWRRKWQPTPVFLPGKFHGWRSMVGYSPWGGKESDTTEPLYLTSPHTGLPRWLGSKEFTYQCRRHRVQCLGQGDGPGEGNGNPLQYSGLGYPMDREAWWVQSIGSQRVRHDLVTEHEHILLLHLTLQICV